MLVYEFNCPRPSCGRRLRARCGAIRAQVICPKCGGAFRLPMSGEVRVRKPEINEVAWRAGFRLLEATGVFLAQPEQPGK